MSRLQFALVGWLAVSAVGCVAPPPPQRLPANAAPVFSAPVVQPTTWPAAPTGPATTGPIGTGLDRAPIVLTPAVRSPFAAYPPPLASGPFSPQLADLGRQIDGRAVPAFSTSQPGFRHLKTAVHSGSKADRVRRRRSAVDVSKNALAPGLPTTPQEDLKYRGGKTLRDLSYINIYVGGENGWQAGERKTIDAALEAGMTDPHLNHVLMQYFQGQPVTASFRGSFVLSGFQAQKVTQYDVKQLTQILYSRRALPSDLPLDSSIICYYLPKGMILEDPSAGSAEYSHLAKSIPIEDEANSTEGLGGYHGSLHLNGQTLYYAVVVYSERRPDGRANGIPAFAEPWKSIVATMYHELQEARTDPDVDDAIETGRSSYLGWTSDKGEEIADFPVDEAQPLSLVFKEVPLADGSGKVPVQLLYSNAVHGPEGPIAKPYSGNPLPPAQRRTTWPPSTSKPTPSPAPGPTPAPQPKPPQGADPDLDWLNTEWQLLPADVKMRILKLIEDTIRQQPAP